MQEPSSNELGLDPANESPFKGKTGLRRVWNAFSLPDSKPPTCAKTLSARKSFLPRCSSLSPFCFPCRG